MGSSNVQSMPCCGQKGSAPQAALYQTESVSWTDCIYMCSGKRTNAVLCALTALNPAAGADE